MEIRNLDDKYYGRLDQSDSRGRSIINQINILVKTRPVHRRKKIFFYRNWKGHWRCLRLGTCFTQHLPVRIFTRGVTQGSEEITTDAPVIPISKLVKSGRMLEVPMVGDMIHSTPANEDPCQGEMPKVRNPSIPKKVMAVVVSLYMTVETLMLIMML